MNDPHAITGPTTGSRVAGPYPIFLNTARNDVSIHLEGKPRYEVAADEYRTKLGHFGALAGASSRGQCRIRIAWFGFHPRPSEFRQITAVHALLDFGIVIGPSGPKSAGADRGARI